MARVRVDPASFPVRPAAEAPSEQLVPGVFRPTSPPGPPGASGEAGIQANVQVHGTFPGKPMFPRASRSGRGEVMRDEIVESESPTADGQATSRRRPEFTGLTTRGQGSLIASRPDGRACANETAGRRPGLIRVTRAVAPCRGTGYDRSSTRPWDRLTRGLVATYNEVAMRGPLVVGSEACRFGS